MQSGVFDQTINNDIVHNNIGNIVMVFLTDKG